MNDRTALDILLVDDDRVSLQILARQLAACGHRVLTAANGEDALGVLAAQQVPIVISDWIMPGVDGPELCRRIRAGPRGERVYFIMLTVYTEKPRLIEAFDAGVHEFLSKPVCEGELLARLHGAARVVRLQEELARGREAACELAQALYAANLDLQHAAVTDELTDLYNRRHAMAKLQEYWAVADRYGQPMACLILDVDHFKNVNDGFGHAAGDAVLQHVAALLRQTVRRTDVVCRIGGEEFLVLCPNQTDDQAAVSADRCRCAVASNPLRHKGRPVGVTISAGVAGKAGSADPEDMLAAADTALYRAKQNGRNCVSRAHESILPLARVQALPA